MQSNEIAIEERPDTANNMAIAMVVKSGMPVRHYDAGHADHRSNDLFVSDYLSVLGVRKSYRNILDHIVPDNFPHMWGTFWYDMTCARYDKWSKAKHYGVLSSDGSPTRLGNRMTAVFLDEYTNKYLIPMIGDSDYHIVLTAMRVVSNIVQSYPDLGLYQDLVEDRVFDALEDETLSYLDLIHLHKSCIVIFPNHQTIHDGLENRLVVTKMRGDRVDYFANI